jgi:hypothetical protein
MLRSEALVAAMLTLAWQGAWPAEREVEASKAPVAELTCRTNKTDYVSGEPIYVTVAVNVLPGSRALRADWFVPGLAFFTELYSARSDGDFLHCSRESHSRLAVEAKPWEVQSGSGVTTTLELVYGMDYQAHVMPDMPGVNDDRALARMVHAKEVGLHAMAFGPGTYGLRVVQLATTPAGKSVELKARSNPIRIHPPDDNTADAVSHWMRLRLLALQHRTSVEHLQEFEGALHAGRFPRHMRVFFWHTAAQGYADLRKWRDAERCCEVILRTYPGYPLQEEVEFDLATAYLSFDREDIAKKALADLADRTSRSRPFRIVHTVARLRSDMSPSRKAAMRLYDTQVQEAKKRDLPWAGEFEGEEPGSREPDGEPR